MAVDVQDLINSPSRAELEDKIFGANDVHPWYYDTTSRAEIMSLFYNAIDVDESDIGTLKRILPQSSAESDEDYNHRISRTPVIPFEKMFVRSKERIFQGHGVSRELGEAEFWDHLTKNFDDQGDTIDKFFRKKVFKYKELYGFGGIVVDLLTKIEEAEDGSLEFNTYEDETGNPVPYAYLVRPSEIYDFGVQQGYLRYVIIRQDIESEANEFDYRYTALTPDEAFVWKQELATDENDLDSHRTVILMQGEHDFGKVPFQFIKGEEDLDSAYVIGRPERYSLIPMYRTAIEIYYDLQEVSLLYSHPVPVMSERQVKELIGAIDDDGKYRPEVISAQLGAVVQVPENEDLPDQMFYQPDTSGLDHLKEYLFEIIESVHKFASIRDKSQIVANNSGVSKALDTVEERGVLASSSRDMEELERGTLSLMSQVRSDIDFDPDSVNYQKEFDLSTASEHFETMIDGMAQGALTYEMYRYHAIEGLRKSGAPQEKIKEVKDKLDEFGMPIKTNAKDIINLVQNADENTEQLIEQLGKEYKILENFVNRMDEMDSESSEEPSEGDQFPEEGEDEEEEESESETQN